MKKYEILIIDDKELLNTDSLVNAYIRKVDKENTRTVCRNLLVFCFEKSILRHNPLNEKGDFVFRTIRESHLTEKGKLIFDDLVDKWLGYTDNKTGNIDRKNNIKMLEKYYNKLIMQAKK